MTDKSNAFDIAKPFGAGTVRILTTSPATRFYSGAAFEKLRREQEGSQCPVHEVKDTPQTRTMLNAYKAKDVKSRRLRKRGVIVMGNPVVMNMSSTLRERIAAKLVEVDTKQKAKRDNWKARYKKPTKRIKR